MLTCLRPSIVGCVSGEEWLVRKVGAYLPGAHEEVLDIVNAFILTDKVILTLCSDWIGYNDITPV